MGSVYITDYIDSPDIEKEILGDQLANKLDKNIEVILVWHERIDQTYIDNLPNLKGIVRYGVGVDNLDVAYANSKGIYVCNTPDYGTEEVSDTAIGMILNIARGISRYDFQCRSYRKNWQENIIQPLKRTSQQVLGVIGAGRIGGSVVLKANTLRFQTVIYDPYKNRGYEKLLGAKRVESVEELLTMSDIISIHTPLTEETQGMVNEDFIAKMKYGASFVNTARGKLVKDVDIFYHSLKSGAITNLALDVLPEEPPIDFKLIRAWKNRESWLDGRLIINPHSAYYSSQSYLEMREKAALNAQRILKNEKPFNFIRN
jgi:lactate dehydrogenase-like 2-hydroxyacid dehydrogenase